MKVHNLLIIILKFDLQISLQDIADNVIYTTYFHNRLIPSLTYILLTMERIRKFVVKFHNFNFLFFGVGWTLVALYGVSDGVSGSSVPALSWASFSTTFLKNCGRGFGLGTTHVLIEVGVSKGMLP